MKVPVKMPGKAGTPAPGSVPVPVPAAANGGAVPMNSQQTNPMPANHPTDAYIPAHMSQLVPELDSYQQLLEAEKKLDIYLARKKIDLYQSVSQWTNSRQVHRDFTHHDADQVKYLRIYVSNIAESQPWQEGVEGLANGSWTMRIEGRLLDGQSAEDAARPKFSSYIQDIAVDFKKNKSKKSEDKPADDKPADEDVDMTAGEDAGASAEEVQSHVLQLPLRLPDSISGDASDAAKDADAESDELSEGRIYDAVEWHFDAKNPVDFDGLDIKRPGTENVECTVTIQLKGFTGSNLEYSPDLALLIGKSQGSLHEAIYSIYKYILLNNLLVDERSEAANVQSSTANAQTAPANGTNGQKTVVQLDDFLARLLPESARPKAHAQGDRNGESDADNNQEEVAQKSNVVTTLKLSEIPPLVNSHIQPIRPIRTDYTIRVDKASTYGELVFDVEVPDITKLQQQQQAQQSDELTTEGLKLLAELDKLSSEVQPRLDELTAQASNLQLQLNASAAKHSFFQKVAEDPVPALQEYMASTANALKVLSGDEGYNEDTVRRAQFYTDNEGTLFENLGVLLANGRI